MTKITIDVEMTSDTHCGNCRMLIEDADFCIAFQQPLWPHYPYERCDLCLAAEKENHD